MPSRNEVKVYLPNSFYHLYNRGVEKRIIFPQVEDYSVFLSYLKNYLLPKNTDEMRKRLTNPDTYYKEKNKIAKLLRMNNFSQELDLLVYGLMPNHFHFLVLQNSPVIIDKFMNSLMTRYSMYINKKYKRVGHLFQSAYKAVLVDTDEQFLYLSRYIHFQTLFSKSGKPLINPYPSSYHNYLGIINQAWLKTDKIIAYFNKSKGQSNSYREFVEDQLTDKNMEYIIKNLKIEN